MICFTVFRFIDMLQKSLSLFNYFFLRKIKRNPVGVNHTGNRGNIALGTTDKLGLL